jgi:ubiquinol-cytochrome c reductase cytochrome c1 subunit
MSLRLHLLVALFIVLLSGFTNALAKDVHLDEANIDPQDKASLQRGAKYFVDYCFNCHSLSYSRYKRISVDLDISEDDISNEMLYTGAKLGDTMTIALRKEDAKNFFGTAPPDLSVVSRSRGIDWIYTYLRSFYRDESRPWGVNNTVFKDVAMPHVLWELQGLQEKLVETKQNANGKEETHFSGFKLIQAGAMKPDQFDDVVRDIVNFLHYVGEPAKQKRLALGRWVLIFLAVYFVVALLLKKEYWRDVKNRET